MHFAGHALCWPACRSTRSPAVSTSQRSRPGPEDSTGLIDPARQGPTFWFQQLDEPRPERNRVHFDIAAAHDDAERRIGAALAAGGRMISDAEARSSWMSFWILADVEGNEICVSTWQSPADQHRD